MLSEIASESLNFAKSCEFSFEVDDVVSGIPITDTSFVLYDSIYSLYPKATIRVNDTSGAYNEFMGFVNGTKIKISYGLDKESWKKCTYRVVQNSVPEGNNPSRWGGTFELSLVHDYIFNQNKKSRAYDSNISDIINTLTKNYSFESRDIDTTLNSGIWYQPYVNDAEFITKYLLPFSYSTDSEKSPFFCFIDSNNNFHFKNYNRLMLQNAEMTYYYKSKGLMSGIQKDTIVTISFAQNTVADTKEFYHRHVSKYDENGNYVKNEIDSYITDFPKNETNPIPVKMNTECVTGILTLFNNDVLANDTKNNNLGMEINHLNHGIFSDTVIITIPFNRDVCAGKIIEVNLPSVSGDSDTAELSLRYSGNYIVVSSYQKWDGRNSSTIIVCSKQVVKVTSDYRNVALIVNRD